MLPAISALVLAAALLPPPPGDAVPAAIEALLTPPDDPFFFSIPPMLDADPLALVLDVGVVRCLADVGDVTGDGAPDLAAGSQPRTAQATLAVRDGRSGALLWSASPGGDPRGGFRALRGLEARDGRLAAAGTTADGSIDAYDAASGALLWRTALAARDPSDPADLYAASWVDDVDGDGVDDLAVAGGHRVDALVLLSGADGALLATHAAGGPVYDVRPASDVDGDGVVDLAVSGGDVGAFARLLSGVDLASLWDAPLDGPGSAVLVLDDVSGDGVLDVAVGQFAEPAGCLLALDGASGARLWTCQSVSRNVTSLALFDDMLDTGYRDILVGSFDNAARGVLSFYGISNWRREVSPNNGGSVLAVAAASDLDGNGHVDVFTCSIDRRPYVMGGETGQFMAGHEGRGKLCAVLALGDGDGDGRPELVVGGRDVLWIFDGNAGTADGPFVTVVPPVLPSDETFISVWAYPTSHFAIYLAPKTGDPITFAQFGGTLLLDPASLAMIFESTAPGAGVSTIALPPFPVEAAGLRVFVQALGTYENGAGWISNLAAYTVPE